jgi:membrane protein
VRWLWNLIKEMWHELGDDGVGDLAAASAFFTLLMLPAGVLAFVASLGSLSSIVGQDVVDDARDEVLAWIERTFGSDAGPIADTARELFDQSNAGIATLSFLVALYALSRGFGGLIRALDGAYDIEEQRRWWWIRIHAVNLGVGTVSLAGFGSYLRYGLWPRLPDVWLLQRAVRPLLLALFVSWALMLLRYGPNHRVPLRYDLPGAIVTSVIWFGLFVGFALYVRIATVSNGALGIVGAALAVFTLAYLVNYGLLIGAELNEILARRAGVVQERPRNRWRQQVS